MMMQQNRTAPLGFGENVFVFLSLLVLTRALSPILLLGASDNEALTDSNPASLASALAIYAIALLLLFQRPWKTVQVIGNNPLLILAFALPFISMFWSEDHGTTFRRSVALVMTGFFCIYIATRLSPEEFLRRLLIALFVGGVASLAYTVLDPSAAIEHSTINNGSWKGVYGHKAILGRIAAIAVMVSIYARPRYDWERLVRWANVAIFVFLSYESQSRASWLMMAGALALGPVLWTVRTRYLSTGLKTFLIVVLATATLAAAIVNFDALLEILGRDDTFSGRTTLWRGAIAVGLARHPILGAGYRAFWTESGAEGVRIYIQNWGGLPAHGHNGYMDIWLEMGIPGVLVFIAVIAFVGFGLMRRMAKSPREGVWSAMMVALFVFLLNNASSSVSFQHTDIAWAFVVLAALYIRGSQTARNPAYDYLGRQPLRARPAYAAADSVPDYRPVGAKS